MTDYEKIPSFREPKGARKTDLLAVLFIFAFAALASLTFLR
jgi:hypothetical protein